LASRTSASGGAFYDLASRTSASVGAFYDVALRTSASGREPQPPVYSYLIVKKLINSEEYDMLLRVGVLE
jgi:hypothetical protein